MNFHGRANSTVSSHRSQYALKFTRLCEDIFITESEIQKQIWSEKTLQKKILSVDKCYKMPKKYQNLTAISSDVAILPSISGTARSSYKRRYQIIRKNSN